MRISIGADVCKKYDASFIITFNEIELLLPIDNGKVFEILTDWMSPSCDRGHSGKLIITRATTVAQTAPNYRDVLHCVARYNPHSGVQLSRFRTNAGLQQSRAEPGTGSNLSNHSTNAPSKPGSQSS